MISLQEICELLQANSRLANANYKDILITSIEQDHRQVKKGSLFICLSGHKHDGHNFIDEAIKNGAEAIICEHPVTLSIPVIVVEDTKKILPLIANRFYNFPSRHLKMIGITGTNGKTTTSKILEHILTTAKYEVGIIGTLYSKYKQKTYPALNTTPDSLTLQKTLQQMQEESVNTVVMEVSSHALSLKRVHGCSFDIAVFTNLQPEHLDFHANLDEYLQAKSLLFSQLGSELEKKVAVLNIDDDVYPQLDSVTQAQIITYGIKKKANIQATNIKQTTDGTQFTCHTPAGTFQASTNLIGTYNLYNLLASVAVATALKIEPQTIFTTIKNIATIPGRFEKISAGQDFTVIVDYAHTADGLTNILSTLQTLPHNNILTVVGCGGDRDITKRPLMAKVTSEKSDYAIFTADNPRTESQDIIFKHMETGVQSNDNFTFIYDRFEAINYALNKAQKDDIVLIAGRGHEKYQIIGTKLVAFDDREISKQILTKLIENKN